MIIITNNKITNRIRQQKTALLYLFWSYFSCGKSPSISHWAVTISFIILIFKHKIGADCNKNDCMFLAAEMLDVLSEISRPFNYLAIKKQAIISSDINLLATAT